MEATPRSTELTASDLNCSVPKFNPASELLIDSSKSILLQTTSAMIFYPNDYGAGMKLRIVLDKGSQPSYLTQLAQDAFCL